MALVLPNLLVELFTLELEVEKAGSKRRRTPPLGVVLVEKKGEAELPATTRLDAVSQAAHRLGIRPGQTLAEASTVVSDWVVGQVTRAEVMAALSRVAEVAMAFGTPVSITAPAIIVRTGYVPDTVWLEITGSAHLFGGEQALAAELQSAVRTLGHVVKSAVGCGPWLGQALARWSIPQPRHGQSEKQALAALPLAALPLGQERTSWLLRLGLFTIGDLVKLPRRAAVARLGDDASQILDLCAGIDRAPLLSYDPPRVLQEELDFEHPIEGLEPLLFALRRLTARMSARLMGRGEAAQEVVLRLEHDRAVVRLREIAAWAELRFELFEPLAHADKLFRVIQARLERHQLLAPTVRMGLEVPLITRAPERQLDLSRVYAGLPPGGEAGAEALPVLLGELLADLGPGCVGVLATVDTHRPEGQSILSSPLCCFARLGSPEPCLAQGRLPHPGSTPTRMLPHPIPLGTALRAGAPLRLDETVYAIEKIAFEERLQGVEWWHQSAINRDYFRVWLRGEQGVIEALAFQDQRSGARFIQAIVD